LQSRIPVFDQCELTATIKPQENSAKHENSKFLRSSCLGTSLDKQWFIHDATDSSLNRRGHNVRERKDLMKTVTKKEFVSLALIAIIAPVLALGLVLAIRTLASGNEFLLLALTLCGAVVSGINGFGRRTVTAQSQSRSSRGGPHSSVALTS
jgi:hypothetical protein